MMFKDKIVVVTGAASGIGLATARRFAEEGATVMVNDIDPGRAEAVAAELSAVSGNALSIPGDAASSADVDSSVSRVMSLYGRIDILVNNAGIAASGPSETIDPEIWRRTVEVNLFGSFHWAQAVAAASMLPRLSGCIVNVSSAAGLAGLPNNCAYTVSKHGIVGLTRSLAVEWGAYGIRVNCVCPGFTETELVRSEMAKDPAMFASRTARIPLDRGAQPVEQAEVILFLCSPAASYIQGLIMSVDGGQGALHPGFAPRRVIESPADQ